MEGMPPIAETVTDMDDNSEMKKDAFAVGKTAIDSYTEETEISKAIKTHFDQKYGPSWHCIVGTHYKSFVTHESKHFIFFYIGKYAILLYKAG